MLPVIYFFRGRSLVLSYGLHQIDIIYVFE